MVGWSARAGPCGGCVMGKRDSPASKGDGFKPHGYDHDKTKDVQDAGGGKHSKDDRGGKDDKGGKDDQR